jgi:hypothetical protein
LSGHPNATEMGKRAISVLAITIAFSGLYFGLRNLPDTQCAALHYEVSRVTDDGIEMCADGPATLIDLESTPFPGSLEWLTPANATQNTSYHGQIALRGPLGDRLMPHELAITHTERVHLMLVHEDLSDYHHLHPVPSGASGLWDFSFTPLRSGQYRVYAECVPLRIRSQVILPGAIEVAENPKPRDPEVQAPDSEAQEPITIHWDMPPGTLRARSWLHFELKVTRADGSTPSLERVMDAWAHVVAFREGTVGLAHLHPEVDDADSLQFRLWLPRAGNYRFWAQIQVNGRQVFQSYDLHVP